MGCVTVEWHPEELTSLNIFGMSWSGVCDPDPGLFWIILFFSLNTRTESSVADYPQLNDYFEGTGGDTSMR